MAPIVITFPSTHQAMAAEDALREAGLPVEVIPLPMWVAANCGLALRMDETVTEDALTILEESGIRVQGRHREPAHGSDRAPPDSP